MSLVLTDAGEKLEITTTAVTIPFTVHYADYVGATPVFTPGVASGDTIVGTKDLLVAPGSGQRVVRTITVHNDSGGADIITIQLDDGGTNYTLVKVTLGADFTLSYDEDGWKVQDANGAMATVLLAHAILSSNHSDAATDVVSQGSIIAGNATPKWDELVIGTAHQILKVNAGGTDPAWTSFDWDELAAAAAADMVHSHGSATEGGATLGPLDSATMAEDAWIGIGAALERIVFNGGNDAIAVMDADLGVNILIPTEMLHLDETNSALEGPNILLDGSHSAGTEYLGGVIYALNTTKVGAVRVKELVANKYALMFQTWDGSLTTKAVLLGGGEFGLGTEVPRDRLHVHKDGDVFMACSTTSGNDCGLAFSESGPSGNLHGAIVWDGGNNTMEIKTGGGALPSDLTARVVIARDTGTVTISNLAGVGTRNVSADANGKLVIS